MSYYIGDKVFFKNVTNSEYAWLPEENIIYVITNKAFSTREPGPMYYSLQHTNINISWIKEEDLFDVKTMRKKKLKKIQNEN